MYTAKFHIATTTSIFPCSPELHFVPTTHELTSTSEHGNMVVGLMYTPVLPPGVEVRSGLDGYDLVIENVPPMIDEDYMPPMESVSYRVIFYYSAYHNLDDFWKQEGKNWSKNIDRFAQPSPKLRAFVQELATPGDAEEQKLRKNLLGGDEAREHELYPRILRSRKQSRGTEDQDG